jgi:hypothetical protein
MHNIYNYTHLFETNLVYVVYNGAALLWLKFMVYVMVFPTINVLYFHVSTF